MYLPVTSVPGAGTSTKGHHRPVPAARHAARPQLSFKHVNSIAQSASVVGETAAHIPDTGAGGKGPGKPLRLRTYQALREVAWTRWENIMYKLLDEKEAAEDGAGVDGAGEEEQAAQDMSGDWQQHFEQYLDPAVHYATMSDSVYMSAWAQAIQQLGPEHIKGKLVIDLGCGPGLLSLMCAKAGAKQVLAVDACKAMTDVAKQVAAANGLSDVIQVVHSRVEDLRLNQKVDVLVCGWPGAGLLSGGMVQVVAAARHHLLKPGGLVLPSAADMYVTGIEDRAALAGLKKQWEDVHGFDLTPVMSQVVTTPRITTLGRPSQLCTNTVPFAHLELSAITRADARAGLHQRPFQLTCQRSERVFGLMMHFDLTFGAAGGSGQGAEEAGGQGARFTTDPRAPPTHFQQLVLNFPRSIKVNQGDVIDGTISMVPSGVRGQDVQIEVQVAYAGVTASVSYLLAHGLPVEAHASMLAQAAEV